MVSHQPGPGEVPGDEQHGGDETEDEQGRADRRELEVLPLVVLVPPRQAVDQPERRDQHGAVWIDPRFIRAGVMGRKGAGRGVKG